MQAFQTIDINNWKLWPELLTIEYLCKIELGWYFNIAIPLRPSFRDWNEYNTCDLHHKYINLSFDLFVWDSFCLFLLVFFREWEYFNIIAFCQNKFVLAFYLNIPLKLSSFQVVVLIPLFTDILCLHKVIGSPTGGFHTCLFFPYHFSYPTLWFFLVIFLC